MTTHTLVKLVDIVIKKNCIQFLDKTFKQKWGTAIETIAPPYPILFIADFKKLSLSGIKLNYISDMGSWWIISEVVF